MIEPGNIVEGIVREKRHMKVLRVTDSGRIEVEWYDESGHQTANLPAEAVDVISKNETIEFTEARQRSLLARRKSEELREVREQRRQNARESRNRRIITKN